MVGGDIELDDIDVELTDNVIKSLHSMPEHRGLTTNWSAMIQAIKNENPAGDNEPEEVARQRVLLRMLACSADLALSETQQNAGSRKKGDSGLSHEVLSTSLLKALPQLLVSFKADRLSLQSLTELPQYLKPSVFALSSRKSDFVSLLRNLCNIFLESIDPGVLRNIAASLCHLMEGQHSRTTDVKGAMKKLSSKLQEHLTDLLQESEKDTRQSPKKRSSRGSRSSQSTSSSQSNIDAVDREFSILWCLRRFQILTKLCPLNVLFDAVDADDELEGFTDMIREAMASKIKQRQPIIDENEMDADDRSVTVPDIWKKEDPEVHELVSESVEESLKLLLQFTAWKLRDTLAMENDDDVDVDDMAVLKMRNSLSNLLGVCFEQHLEERDHLEYSEEQIEFSLAIQSSAGSTMSDIRTLFPKEWQKSDDRVRQALAFTDDKVLVGGFARYMQSREEEVRFLSTNTSNQLLFCQIFLSLCSSR